jgi:dihydrolipoamide dehydrogenase
VDKDFRTNIEGIYAIGDVIACPMLPHKAENEKIARVEIIASQAGHANQRGACCGPTATNTRC